MSKSIFYLSLSFFFCLQLAAQKVDQNKIWKEAEQQLSVLLKSNDWTSGFFPGMLWMMYERTGKQEWKVAAQEFTALMKREPYNRNSHDVGFKVYDSYGQGYRVTKDSSYKKLIIQAAKTLASRFNPKVGCIRSWDFGKWQYPVIIDNMMNLELLFAATKFTGDSSFYRIAVSHANTTLKNHFRSDFSSYHVVDYDTATGQVIGKGTHQGYADESAWARGQAWALYGYTMCYRETKNKQYLILAENVASFILKNPSLPKDGVPYWDYNVPNKKDEPRDASAATVTASALYELATFTGKKAYRQAADKMLSSIVAKYRAPFGSAHGFLLLHSTGNKPANGEVDEPIIYADYYFLEALNRMN
ncbi:MAG: glucuronyl hydrolase [Chitinophagaceae bacterium]|nr:MAG: glucuronyl hydrolase [Chitinophagaceae bacterium]